MAEVLVCTRDSALREQLRAFFAARGCGVAVTDRPVARLDDAVEGPTRVTLIIVDWSATPGDTGVALVRHVRQHGLRPSIFVLARDRSEDLAIQALRLRVDNYLKYPLPFEELIGMLRQHLDTRAEPLAEGAVSRQRARTSLAEPAAAIREAPPAARSTAPAAGEATALDAALVGETPQMRAMKAYLQIVARTDSNVLITGETGTGKEIVAEQLHRAGRRRDRPFVCINCAAIPESLVESELFGYERGAFTGAVGARAGKMQQANGGTVFFDEIGEMSRF